MEEGKADMDTGTLPGATDMGSDGSRRDQGGGTSRRSTPSKKVAMTEDCVLRDEAEPLGKGGGARMPPAATTSSRLRLARRQVYWIRCTVSGKDLPGWLAASGTFVKVVMLSEELGASLSSRQVVCPPHQRSLTEPPLPSQLPASPCQPLHSSLDSPCLLPNTLYALHAIPTHMVTSRVPPVPSHSLQTPVLPPSTNSANFSSCL